MTSTPFLPYQRGQALVESAIFLPLMILSLLGIIFFDRIGVLSERAQSAVRYGDMVSFRNGEAYSVAAIGLLLQNTLGLTGGNPTAQLLDLCLAPGIATVPAPGENPTTAATGVSADIAAALVQAQVPAGAPMPAFTTPPLYLPDAVQQPACTPGSISFTGETTGGVPGTPYPARPAAPGSNSNLNLPLSTTGFSITADVLLPPAIAFMQNGCAMAAGPCLSATANMTFLNVATPTTLLTCVPGLNVVLLILAGGAPLTQPPLCQ